MLFTCSSSLLSAAISSSFCGPGRSTPGPLPPRMFQSRASAPRMFQSGRIASPDVPVQVPCACLPFTSPFLSLVLLVLPPHLSGFLFMNSFSVLAAAAAPSSRSLGRSHLTISCAAPLPVDPDWLRCFPG